MKTRPVSTRWNPGFSLDDAARIRRMIVTRDTITCLGCGKELAPKVGLDGERRVWMVRCDGCGRGVVVHGNG